MPYGLTGHPGHYSLAIKRRPRKLGELVHPRVHAAVFSTLWNRWATQRRFQRRLSIENQCVFTSSRTAEDSLEHYCRCPAILRVARHMVHFEYPAEQALNIWALNSAWLDDDDNMRGLSLLVYGAYMGFNSFRHEGVSGVEQAVQCITQHARQGAMGHTLCMEYLDSRWQQPMNYVI